MLERSLPAAVAVVVAGGAVIATSVVMRGQLVGALHRACAPSALAARFLAAAVPIDGILESARLRKRKPAHVRGVPLVAICSGLVAAGAETLLLAARWRGARAAAIQPIEFEDRSSGPHRVHTGRQLHPHRGDAAGSPRLTK